MVRSFVILFMLAALPATAVAQAGPASIYERPSWFIGYVANAPHLLLGGTVAAIPPALGGWGLYLDAKTGIDSPAGDEFYRDDLSHDQARQELGDTFSSDQSHWRSFNAAVVRAFSDNVIIYLGGGVAEEQVYSEFYDPSGERGNLGYYWVKDEDLQAWRGNAMGGMYFRIMRHLAFQAGVESTPVGLTVGLIAVF